MKYFICTILSLVVFSLSGCNIFHMGEVHITTDINDYGKFPTFSENENHRIEKYTDIILPEKIEEFFFEPSYYFGYCKDPFMCEVYLEFKIEDETQYKNYITELTQGKATQKFFYDETFKECVITDVLWLEHGVENRPILSKSEVQKILFSDESNTVIFISLIVLYPDMTFPVKDFYYFEKFNIDVEKYYNGERLVGNDNDLSFLY